MLCENLRNIRRAKGLSQEELAVKLNVVRQTISKWEKGLSVPDSEMLIRIGEALETPVSVLLDETVKQSTGDEEIKTIAAKLEVLNEQFARRNESRRKLWRALFIALGTVAIIVLILSLASELHFYFAMMTLQGDPAVIGGSDGPTQIFVSSGRVPGGTIVIALAVVVLCAVGFCKTRGR